MARRRDSGRTATAEATRGPPLPSNRPERPSPIGAGGADGQSDGATEPAADHDRQCERDSARDSEAGAQLHLARRVPNSWTLSRERLRRWRFETGNVDVEPRQGQERWRLSSACSGELYRAPKYALY